MSDTATRLLELVSDQLGQPTEPLADPLDAQLKRDYRVDSLDVVALTMEIEETFRLSISDDEAFELAEATTLRDLVALIDAKVAAT